MRAARSTKWRPNKRRKPLQPVAPHALKAMLADGGELALIDPREELIFSRGHLLHARSVPLSRLELNFARLVPRLETRIVLCDEADGLAERAAGILARAGYENLFVLAGGVAAWKEAGLSSSISSRNARQAGASAGVSGRMANCGSASAIRAR